MELTAAVTSLSCKAALITNDLRELHSCYTENAATIEAICHEVGVLRAIFSRVQRMLERDGGAELSDELRDVFDIAITGCTVVLSCLDAEIIKLLEQANGARGGGGMVSAKYLWREATMMDLLLKLQVQQDAVSLLFQSLQMDSVFELHHLLRERTTEMHQAQTAADSLRKAHPDVGVPESVLDPKSGSNTSNIEFSFDEELVNSEAYRRVLSKAHPRRRPKSPELESIPEIENGEASAKTAKI